MGELSLIPSGQMTLKFSGGKLTIKINDIVIYSLSWGKPFRNLQILKRIALLGILNIGDSTHWNQKVLVILSLQIGVNSLVINVLESDKRNAISAFSYQKIAIYLSFKLI